MGCWSLLEVIAGDLSTVESFFDFRESNIMRLHLRGGMERRRREGGKKPNHLRFKNSSQVSEAQNTMTEFILKALKNTLDHARPLHRYPSPLISNISMAPDAEGGV